MPLPIPYVWHVFGTVRLPDGVPFNQGKIKAFDVQNGVETQLGETGFDQGGNYTITYSSANFQKGDVNRTAPNLIVRVYDYQERILWQSSIIANASSEQKLDIVLGGDPVPETWKVSGTVTKADGSLLGSGAVVVGDSLAGQLFELSRSSLGSDGKFSVTYLKSSFQRGDTTRTSPNLVFAVQDAQGTLLTSMELGRVATADETVAISIPHTPPVPKPTYSVFGSLTNRLALPLSGKSLDVYCLDFSDPEGFKTIVLGRTYSDEKGRYALDYDPALLPRPIPVPDTSTRYENIAIYVELHYLRLNNQGAMQDAVFPSPLVLDGSRSQQIDFVFDEESRSILTEFGDLNTVLAKYRIALLGESVVNPITGQPKTEAEKIAAFLASTTRFPLVVGREGLDGQSVRAYFLAYQISYELIPEFTEVGQVSLDHVETIFGLVRNGSAPDRLQLLALAPTNIHSLLTTSMARKQIASTIDIEAFMVIWKAIFQSTSRYTADPGFGMYHKLVLVLHGTLDPNDPPTTAQKARISALLAKHFEAAGNDRDFLDAVKPVPGGTSNLLDMTEWLRFEMLSDLNDFGGGDPDFTIGAFTTTQQQPGGPRSLPELLAATPVEWDRIADATSVEYCKRTGAPAGSLPPDFVGATPLEKKAIFSQNLQEAIVVQYPQRQVVATLPGLVVMADQPRWQAVSDFLTSNAGQEFDLDSTRLDLFLDAHPAIVLDESTKTGLRTLQRLYRLTTDTQAIAHLISAQPPLDSAQKIAQEDEDQFLADHAVALGGLDKARQIHRMAVHYTAELAQMLARYHSSLNFEGGSALAIPRGVTATGNNASRVVANWTNLFGALNQQKISKGQSILSPSAYFVDLLEYLRGDTLNLLLSRRPDLLGLELTQANAETALPTIDLAIELLEALAARQDLQVYQTHLDGPQLRAEPEHSNTSVAEAAYRNLTTSLYPSMLPVNFPREEARLLLEKKDLGWRDLAIAIVPTSRRHLVMDGTLENALTGSVNVWELWGLAEHGNSVLRPDKATPATGSWHEVLAVAAIFLDRSGLSMQELLDLLATRSFKNSGVSLASDALGYQEGDINRFQLVWAALPDLTVATTFARDTNRFLRLKRLLGWSLEEMDQAWGLTLDNLDVVQDLHLSLGVPVLQVLAWGEAMQDGLFATTFKPSLNDTTLSQVYIDLFEHRTATLAPELFARWVGSRLGLGQSDLEALLTALGIALDNDQWIRSKLENIQRLSSFAKSQKLSIPDFLKLAGWFGLGTGAARWTWIQCRDFIETLSDLKSTSIPGADWMELAWPPTHAAQIAAKPFLVGLGASLDALRASWIPWDVSTKPAPATEDEFLAALDKCLVLLGLDGSDKIAKLAMEDKVLAKDLQPELTVWIDGLVAQGIVDASDAKDLLTGWFGDSSATPPIDSQPIVLERLKSLFKCLSKAVTTRLETALVAEIKTQLVAKFAITEEICSSLLEDRLLSVIPPLPGKAAGAVLADWKSLQTTISDTCFQAYFRFAKAAKLATALELKHVDSDRDDLAPWMPGAASGVAFPDWNSFPCDLPATIAPPLALGRLLPLIQVLHVIEAYGLQSVGYSVLADRDTLTAKFDLRSADLEALLVECNIAAPSAPPAVLPPLAMNEPGRWVRFGLVLDLFRKSKSLPSVLRTVLQPIPATSSGMAEYTAAVAHLRGSLMATMTPTSWREFIQPISDGLRMRKRDALAAYVCWRSQQDSFYTKSFFDSNDLYAHYLLDVQMEPDMSVSRILQAQLSIQQLVQRGFLGLEGRFTLSDKQKAQWDWMKNYRVWEANRKVFLYPENWIEAELRDDKTPFFKELENSLLQSDDNGDARKAVFAEYLQKIKEVSGLEIVGATKEAGGPDGVDHVLHVVGRTRGTPHVFYYRRYLAKALYSGEWTPWERIDAEIPALIVIPALLNKRLYLTWPVYQQSQEQAGPVSGSANSVGSTESQSRLEVRLEWIHFDGVKWSGKKTSKSVLADVTTDFIQHFLAEEQELGDQFHLRVHEASNEYFEVEVYRTREDYDLTTETKEIEVNSSNKVKQTKIKIGFPDRPQWMHLFGSFKIWADGRDQASRESATLAKITLSKDSPSVDFPHAPVTLYPPYRCRLVHNYWVEDDRLLDPDKGNDQLTSPVVSVQPVRTFTFDEWQALRFSWPSLMNNVILNSTPGNFRILPVNFSFFTGEALPFFFMDGQSTYFVQQQRVMVRTWRRNSGWRYSRTTVERGIFKFDLISHPLVDEFHKRFRDGSQASLFTRETQALPIAEGYFGSYSNPAPHYGGGYSYGGYYANVYLGYSIAGDNQAWDLGQNLFESRYLPNPDAIAGEYPEPIVDFTWGTSNGLYNWELFFHVPMLLAGKMTQEQRYEDAMMWFHQVFDPRMDLSMYERGKSWVSALPKGSRFWKFLPFFANKNADDSISETLGMPTADNQSPDQEALQSLVDKWKNDPFNPHLIARNRPAAYQKYVVMKYLDNLIAWADELFKTDTTESINEAVQLYVLAAEILGPRAAEVPQLVTMAPLTAQDVLDRNADALGNVLVELEDQLVATRTEERSYSQRALPGQTSQLLSLSTSMFYFAIPRNEKLLGYWDTVADRLYKIRNSLNFEGVKRVLSLYAPPIDPGMLVRAKAAGLDLGAVLSGSDAPLPLYRFQVMLQKAVELARDVQGLGNTLLSALEKKDGETLSLLRTANEEELLKLNLSVRNMQLSEANMQLEVLQNNRNTTEERRKFYAEIVNLSEAEQSHLKLAGDANDLDTNAASTKLVASVLAAMPDFSMGGVINAFGGPQFGVSPGGGGKASRTTGMIAEAMQIRAQVKHASAGLIQVNAGYERRWNDWKLQERLADKELASIDKQILAAQIRISQTEKEMANLERQIEQADEVYTFMRTRFSNQELYQWLATQLGLLHSASYKLALDVAKRAERCYQFELGLDPQQTKSIIKSGQWDGLHKGLLAGERLLADLRQLDISFMEKNRREQEITKPVSLALLSPTALRDLQQHGTCEFDIPEALFDLDFPGHYFRRIKAVRLEIPCNAGPYTSVSAKLTLLENRLRATTALDGGNYAPGSYVENRVGIQSIATSQAQNDAGLFEFNFRDERYLPFEGAGAISKWRLELPDKFRQFDYDSIADAVLHMSYTAREGGDRLKKKATEAIQEAWQTYEAIKGSYGWVNEIRLGRDFHDNFQQLRTGLPTTFQLDARNFPAFVEGQGKLQEIRIYALPREGQSINAFAISVDLADPAGAKVDLSAASSNASVTDSTLPVWQWPVTPPDPVPDTNILGTWTLQTAAGATVLPALGDIVIELRYFPTAPAKKA